MIIHVVQPGESIYTIARTYGVSPQKIIIDNEIENPNIVVPGQTIVILQPDQVHVVQPSDTLESIAKQYNTTTVKLLQNNPFIGFANAIFPGDQVTITTKGQKRGPIFVNGYAYPNIDRDVLMKTLPYLTYLTLFTYGITNEGELIDIEDEELIKIARDYGVAPLMLISTLTEEGTFSNELAHVILNNENIQNNLIENVLKTLKEKQYYGLDIDFEYVLPEDREAFANFIKKITTRLNAEGFQVFTALAPKISSTQEGLLYEAHDYPVIGDASNKVLLMTYEWGYTYGPAMAVAPIDRVREVLDYAVTEIDRDKIYMGIPNYGYDFIMPFVQGVSKADSVSNVEAVKLASTVGANIQYDEVSKAPFFIYYDNQGRQHRVWFEDARSIQEKLNLITEYDFEGTGIWNVMRYFPQNWLVLSSLYDIAKLL
ncbi:MAG: glycosyl hydrolase family 18 protein [Sedimentibacter sp.]|uniref:glycosyl hydrolase family 18 protein n=1 Tax=Sedimentibacter sp. TaxID=1960295 RepID=UPI002981DBEC|nr:LysM peptidoglycan-binding domain-containing protein [Sedimentibacter sp.]MDW5299199.1 glycosyl hydrolase family 18 protein [Sedimentibacter sp.]